MSYNFFKREFSISDEKESLLDELSSPLNTSGELPFIDNSGEPSSWGFGRRESDEAETQLLQSKEYQDVLTTYVKIGQEEYNELRKIYTEKFGRGNTGDLFSNAERTKVLKEQDLKPNVLKEFYYQEEVFKRNSSLVPQVYQKYIYQEDDNSAKYVVVIMEIVQGKVLREFFTYENSQNLQEISKLVSKALYDLSKTKIVNNDIHPDNIIHNDDNKTVKIIDFGQASEYNDKADIEVFEIQMFMFLVYSETGHWTYNKENIKKIFLGILDFLCENKIIKLVPYYYNDDNIKVYTSFLGEQGFKNLYIYKSKINYYEKCLLQERKPELFYLMRLDKYKTKINDELNRIIEEILGPR